MFLNKVDESDAESIMATGQPSMFICARVNKKSKPFGLQSSFHPQSVQQLNYAKAFSVCFKARALIASSLPANTPCQVQPLSEIVANQS